MSVQDEEDEAPAPVRNPEENDYNQRQRLKEIWDERKNVREWRREISHIKGQSLTHAEAEQHFHEELKQYLGVVHTLLIDVYATQGGAEMWTAVTLGVQNIEPPSEIAAHVEPKTEPFTGLKTIIETPAVRTVTFEGTISHYKKRDEPVSGTREVTVPWHILDTAWMYLNAFLSRVGFEAEIGDDSRPYDDWRREFENGVYTGPEDMDLPHVQG